MARFLDLVRGSAVPSNLMQSAARGSLSIPAAEMIEVLVYLATFNKIFGQQAAMTLAGWEESSSKAVASDPNTSSEVLEYLVSPENLRPIILPALVENPSVKEWSLLQLISSGSRDTVETMLKSPRVQGSPKLMAALKKSPYHPASAPVPSPSTIAKKPEAPPPAKTAAPSSADDEDEHLATFLAQHHDELKAEGEKPFQPIGGMHEASLAIEEEAEPVKPSISLPAADKPAVPTLGGRERVSTLQRIARLDITGRIQMAMKGTKEERSLLVRDGTKLVALAVLDSPKISDGEVEKIASQKNVLEAVLRQIPLKRRFMKDYIVVRNLVFNPRTPLDVSLGLVKNLLAPDLKNLSGNKEVSETVRKMATRMFKQKETAK